MDADYIKKLTREELEERLHAIKDALKEARAAAKEKERIEEDLHDKIIGFTNDEFEAAEARLKKEVDSLRETTAS